LDDDPLLLLLRNPDASSHAVRLVLLWLSAEREREANHVVAPGRPPRGGGRSSSLDTSSSSSTSTWAMGGRNPRVGDTLPAPAPAPAPAPTTGLAKLLKPAGRGLGLPPPRRLARRGLLTSDSDGAADADASLLLSASNTLFVDPLPLLSRIPLPAASPPADVKSTYPNAADAATAAARASWTIDDTDTDAPDDSERSDREEFFPDTAPPGLADGDFPPLPLPLPPLPLPSGARLSPAWSLRKPAARPKSASLTWPRAVMSTGEGCHVRETDGRGSGRQ